MITPEEAYNAGLELKLSKVINSIFDAVFNDDKATADDLTAHYILGVLDYRHKILKPMLNKIPKKDLKAG